MPTPTQNIHTFEEIIEDIILRFILTCPDEEYESFDRLLFQFESAFWFYLDEYYDAYPDRLRKLNFSDFCAIIFDKCQHLKQHASRLNRYIKSFNQYKNSVAVYGCALLNPSMTKCVMIQSWGSKNSWNFPKGKINKNESESECAIRETFEEIGYQVPPDHVKDMIDSVTRGKKINLFIVPNVEESTTFQTQTRKEISKIEWHSFKNMSPDNRAYHYAWPLIRKIKQWIRKAKSQKSKPQTKSSHRALVNIDATNGSPPIILSRRHSDSVRNVTPTEMDMVKQPTQQSMTDPRERRQNGTRKKNKSRSKPRVKIDFDNRQENKYHGKHENKHKRSKNGAQRSATEKVDPTHIFDSSSVIAPKSNGLLNFSFDTRGLYNSCQA